MYAVIQRVSKASVLVESHTIAAIDVGLLVLVGFEPDDTQNTLQRCCQKLLQYRLFSDNQGKMNLSLQDINGSLLLVPQFTLAADTTRGLRPSFTKGATPAVGKVLFEQMKIRANALHPHCAFGQFGADMKVFLCNDGPVTFHWRIV